MRRVLLLLVLLCLLPGTALAATLEVGPGRPYSTIQSAVDAAFAGDTVVVYPGTYRESVLVPNGRQGTSSAPIIIRALYSARPPLQGGPWADTSDKLTVLDATGFNYGIHAGATATSAAVRFVLVDGFHIQGASMAGVYFAYDSDIWIRNVVAVNNGAEAGENWGNFSFDHVDRLLVQNVKAELSSSGGPSAAGQFGIDGIENIVEYSECALTSGSPSRGRCFYVHSGARGFIARYNHIRLQTTCETQCWRQRDTTDFQTYNNYVYSSVTQQFIVYHENTDHGLVENHQVHHNTLYWAGGSLASDEAWNFGYGDGIQVFNNIFAAGVLDTGSYAVGNGWNQASQSVAFRDNVWWNWAGLYDPNLCAPGCNITATGSLNVNPGVNATTGCASSVNNAVYGASLDVSQVPYRKCDGTAFPVTTRWSLSTDATAPPPPTNLRVQ